MSSQVQEEVEKLKELYKTSSKGNFRFSTVHHSTTIQNPRQHPGRLQYSQNK